MPHSLTTARQIHYLIYISRMSQTMDDRQLEQILHHARSFNISHGVTGYLLCMDDVFVQYIEGGAPVIQQLFAGINHDPRHTEVCIIAEGKLEKRLFASCEMGFRRLDCSSLIQQTNKALPPGPTYEWLQANTSLCCNLFELLSDVLQ